MIRREALKNIATITGGVFFLPFSCDLDLEISYSNFPRLKKDQINLISSVSNLILPIDIENFPTPEKRIHFIMTMANDCLEKKEIELFKKGFELFQLSLSPVKNESFDTVRINEKKGFILKSLEERSEIKIFLNHLKDFSLLHFETSENYMKNYLNFEFMPGRYLGKVKV